MNLFRFLLFIFLITLISCQQQASKKEDHPTISTKVDTNAIPSKPVSPELRRWVDAVNNKIGVDIQDRYSLDAVNIITPDNIINGAMGIADYYVHQEDHISSIESLYKTTANEKREITYEIVSFNTAQTKEFTQLVIWKTAGGKTLRVFEFTAANDSSAGILDVDDISERRDQWMKLCNENNAANLVLELYSTNALYYNHKPLIIGTEDLTKEYAYMNKEDYQLTLHPIKLEPITDSMAIEIGQCKGSYGGKYILVWERNSDGKWRILLDSNY